MDIDNVSVSTTTEYICDCCDFITHNRKDFNRHLSTKKHASRAKSDTMVIPNFVCMFCNHHYKTSAGLWKHKSKCSNAPKKDEDVMSKVSVEYIGDMKMMMGYLIKDHVDFKNTITELIKTCIPSSNNNITTSNDNNIITNNSNNNNVVTNNSFNLQFYLNETCKNALNINEFIDSIVITLEDLEQTGILGYAEGISRIFIKNLKGIADELWPIHCSDFKRQVIYIKFNGVWNKETDCKAILTKAVKQLANKNMVKINDWKKKYPGCDQADSRKNDMYLKIMMNSMCGGSKEETDSNMNKIVNNIAKHAVIDKIKN